MELSPLTPTIGASVRGVCLDSDRSPELVGQISDALAIHGVLFFEDQPPMEPANQVEFGRLLGDLHVHPAAPHLDGFPEVFVIRTHADSKHANGEEWHTDVSCEVEPPSMTMLQIHTLPPVGGDTTWVSTVAAFHALSEPLRDMLVGLHAVHSSEHVYRGRYADRGVDDRGSVFPSAVHPVVCRHPVSGEPTLFVNRSFTTRIVELDRRESDAILRFLFDHIEQHRFAVRHRWAANDVALWDNRSTQHLAMWDYWPHERAGHRVTFRGDRPEPYVPQPVA